MRQLILWHGRGLRYVTAGHKTMELIDTTLRELHTEGAALATEIREDQIDRAERVDALLARIEGRL
jgi:D-ribose pyranose/furanose isomerase RbsD